jgi:hypothetical protein
MRLFVRPGGSDLVLASVGRDGTSFVAWTCADPTERTRHKATATARSER